MKAHLLILTFPLILNTAFANTTFTNWGNQGGEIKATTLIEHLSTNSEDKSLTDRQLTVFSSRIEMSKSNKQQLYFELDKSVSSVDWSMPYESKVIAFYNTLKGVDACDIKAFDRDKDRDGSISFSRSTIWKINHKNIRMTEWCARMPKLTSGRGYWILIATPKTDKGESFVINAFKKGKSHIPLKLSNGMSVNSSAIGFTKEWNNFGGNAL
ncbi:hypothetical protein [Vibrio harveyi]|uniref:hypothetical protein n=1 Tax=Vibrio harveyi TaxID=669 RepID=UPI0023805DB4|nr:hypothetical protein [Vibrio harveyi]